MAWWDSIIDTVFNFAKSNPALTGAIASGLTGGFQGKYGENNLGNIAGGAALGYGAGKLAEYTGLSVPQAASPVAQGVGSVGSAGLSVPGAMAAPVAQAATPAMNLPTAWGYAADGMGPPLSAMGDSVDYLDRGMAGLEKLRGTATKYGPLLDLGAKGFSAVTGVMANQEKARLQKEYLDKYQSQADQFRADQASTIAENNRRADENVYAARARNVTDTNRAMSAVDKRAGKYIAGLQRAQISPEEKRSNERRARLEAATGRAQALATTQKDFAMPGLQVPSSAPTYSSELAKAYSGSGGDGYAAGLMNVYEDITGRKQDESKKQIGGLTG